MSTKRLFSLSGIAFVALVVLSVGLDGTTPATDASAAEIASFYDDNGARQVATTFVFAAAVPLLVFFAVGLAGVSPRDGRTSAWGHVVIAGAILEAGTILAAALVQFALVDVADGDGAAAAVALNALDGSTWVTSGVGFGVMMLGAAGLLLSTGVMRRLGWAALLLGVALFIPFAFFLSLLLTLVWIVVASVLLTRAPRPTPVPSFVPAH